MKFSDFEEVQVLSRRGRVRTARCRATDGDVVLKIFDQPSDDDRARLRQRATALCDLKHPGLARCHGLVEDENRVALVWDWVAGETLAEHIERGGRLADAELYAFMADVLRALNHAHSRETPIVHRDIKPQNIVLSETGYVLIDFGAATEIEDTAGNSTSVGTTGYAGPEQFVGKATVHSDQYGLAATTLQLATHHHPGDFALRELAIDLSGASVSTPLRQILDRMLSPQPRARYASTQDALKAVEGSGSMTPVQVALHPLREIDSIVTADESGDATQITIGGRTRAAVLAAVPLGWITAAVLVGILTAMDVNAGRPMFSWIMLMMFMVMTTLFTAPLAWREFKRSKPTTIAVNDSTWRVTTGKRSLAGALSVRPEVVVQRERSWADDFGIGQRSALQVRAADGAPLVVGRGMLPIEAQAVADAVETLLRQERRADEDVELDLDAQDSADSDHATAATVATARR